MINKLCHDISFSNTSCERDVLMEHCSCEEIVNMDTSEDPSTLYLYLHLPIVYDPRVLILFTSFKIEFLTAVNMPPPRLLQIPVEYLGISR